MKILKIEIQYITKGDLLYMLERMTDELETIVDETFFDLESNMGGKLSCDYKDVPIPDLRNINNK